MSIRDLFNRKAITFENATTGSDKVESFDYIDAKNTKKQTFIPNIDFSSASNFAKYGSAYEYYTTAIERVYNEYPYDGSDKEKIHFELSSSYLDKWLFDNYYPKTTGYINFSYGGWGSLNGPKTSDGYGLPATIEYIYSRGGMHTASLGMIGKPLSKTFEKSVKYDSENNRTTTFDINLDNGFTVEFWLKKDSFDNTKTEKEVILDLWNAQPSSSVNYGRFTLELSGTATGTDTFRVTLQSGTNGFFKEPIGSSTVTTSSLGNWKHYAFSFVSGASGVTSRMYVNGDIDSQKNLGSVGLGSISGLVNGYIGALQTSPSGSSATQYSGKLNASMDEFRFWKTRRTSEQIYNNFYTHVGGGTNSDDANTTLGLYYKFNEGIVGNSSLDSIILDYSGRIANGSWYGYSAGARNTGSALVLSGLRSSEPKDPIIRSTHPDVVTLLSDLQNSGSQWDIQNTSMLYNRIPEWIRGEDEDDNKNVKYLFQIISSYFDTLHLQITEIPKLRDKEYVSQGYKALPFAEKRLQDKGLLTANLFVNADLFENYNSRDTSKISYEKEITETKNLIYTNIYNNLDYIYKSKGTESSIRNMLRCFGIDDEIVKLNIYTDGGMHYFTDKSKQTTINTNYISFNSTDKFDATIYQTASSNNSNTFITGSKSSLKEVYSAFTMEANIIVPSKLKQHEIGYFETRFLSSSIFGVHEAGSSPEDYTWVSPEIANFQVYLLRELEESDNARFVLTNRDGSLYLTSSLINDIYDNQTWNLAVRIKSDLYPYGGNVVKTSNPNYEINFYGVNHAFGVVDNSFEVSSTISYASGSAFLSRPKRVYAGAHRTNFTGSVLQQSDIKLGSVRFYLDYLDNTTINNHNLDPENYGLANSYFSATMFDSGSSNIENVPFDSAALIWTFNTVTGSDSSGKFLIDDFSSGSLSISSQFPHYITKAYHKGAGFGFPASSTTVAKNEVVYANKKELPEISYTSDSIIVETDEIKHFVKDDDVSDNFFALEKSMYQVVSEEMLKMFSTISEFGNLIGKATDRYRTNYKKMNLIRSMFFDKIEDDTDFDKFTEYFKWIDGAISQFVSQLFPMSARHSNDISDMVESHILERNKYQNKFPILTTHPSTEGQIKGSSEIRYNWKTGHAPVGGEENKNCVWQKLRKERTDIAQREELRKAIITEATGSHITLANSDLSTYKGSTFALRRLSRPYRVSNELKPALHGGINYAPKKDRDIIYHLTQRHGDKGQFGQPFNIVVAGLGTGTNAGIVEKQKCDDVIDPNIKKRVQIDAFAGRYSNDSYTPGAKDESSTYTYRFSEFDLPINIISQSNNSGYNTEVVSRFNSGSIVTNIHSDTTSPTNHIPMQGPFTETWVGGHQHRHVPVNRKDLNLRDDDLGIAPPNNLDNKYTRPEAWRIALGDYVNNDGAIGIVGPDYGGPYPDPARKVAVFYREERAKRPVNIKNIQYTTGSRNLGNYRENYEIISAGGKLQNNLYLRKNPDQSKYLPTTIGSTMPETTHPMSLFGQAPYLNGNVFGLYSNNRQPDGNITTAFFTVTGSSVSGAAAGTFRVNQIGLGGQDVDTTFRFNNSGIGTKNFIIKSGSVPSDSDPNYYVATGSSNINFWDNLKSKMNSVLTNYNIDRVSTNTSYGLNLFSSASVSSRAALTASAIPDFNIGRFTFSCWLNVSGGTALAKKTIFSFKSGSGEASRELYLSGGHLYYESIFHYGVGVTRCHVFKKYPNYEADWDRAGWKHIILTDTQTGTGTFGVADLYLDGVSTGSVNFVSSSTSGIGGCSSTSAQRVESDGNIFFLNDTLDATSNPWQGGIDEITFWNNLVLNASQRAEIYNNGAVAKIMACHISGSNLRAWYNFEDQKGLSGEVILDKTGNGNHLTASSTAGPVYHITSSGITSVPEETYANFTINALTGGASYDATLTVTTACQNFISNIEAPSGGFLSGAMSPDTIEFAGKRFQILNSLNPTPAGSNIGVSADFGTPNSTFWGNLSQSIKNNTIFDTINVVTSVDAGGKPLATFHLTTSIGDYSHFNFTTSNGTLGKPTFTETSSFIARTDGSSFDVVIPVITSSVTNTVITSRFSAPGGIEVQSLGYLDVYSREYSVHNALPFRNLSVRGSGSGESGTIRINSHNNRREGLRTLLSRHCGKFGTDSQYGSVLSSDYNIEASFHKTHRNVGRRPTDTSTISSPVFNEDHNNAHVSSVLPRSDFQYSWVTSSVGDNYSYKSGKQRIYGYTPADGILSSSVTIGGESGFVAAINFPTASEIFGV